jgi:tubulin polyglutamylase TTLL9
MTAETEMDYELKYGVMNDTLDMVDMEKKYTEQNDPFPCFALFTKISGTLIHHCPLHYRSQRTNDKRPKARVGGYDLVYFDGPVKHERATKYGSYLGECFLCKYTISMHEFTILLIILFHLSPSSPGCYHKLGRGEEDL